MKKDILNSLSIIALIFAGTAMAVGLSSMQARLDRLQANVLDLQFTYEEQLNSLSASLQISEPVPLFEDALASGISNSATSFTLIRGTDKTGTNLASSTYGFILSEGSANEEFVLADCTATACTNVVRGYWPLTNATSSALMKTHRRGDTVKITDSPIINQMKRVINGQEDFPNALTFDGKLTYTTAPTFTSTLDIPSKAYVDNSVNQGAATSTESVGGILEIATATEIASTTTDLPNRPLALTTAYSSSTPATGTGPLVIVSKINRKLDQLWLDLTEAFTVTGEWTFNGGGTATTTFNRGVDIDADSDTPLILRLISYIFPSSGGSANQVLTTDGGTPQTLTWTTVTPVRYTWANSSPGLQPSSGNFATSSDGLFIPGGTLTASSTIEVKAGNGTVCVSSSSGSGTVYLRDSSGNTLWSGNLSSDDSSNTGYGRMNDVVIVSTNSNFTAQRHITNSVSGTGATPTSVSAGTSGGTASINFASDVTLKMVVQNSGCDSTSPSLGAFSVVVER